MASSSRLRSLRRLLSQTAGEVDLVRLQSPTRPRSSPLLPQVPDQLPCSHDASVQRGCGPEEVLGKHNEVPITKDLRLRAPLSTKKWSFGIRDAVLPVAFLPPAAARQPCATPRCKVAGVQFRATIIQAVQSTARSFDYACTLDTSPSNATRSWTQSPGA